MTQRRTTQRPMTSTSKHRVAGEDPHLLLPLLARIADGMVLNDRGTYDVHAVYGNDEGPPLLRALMRVEAELLLADARRLKDPTATWRDRDDRAEDALLLLVLRTCAAVKGVADADAIKRILAGTHRRTPRGVK